MALTEEARVMAAAFDVVMTTTLTTIAAMVAVATTMAVVTPAVGFGNGDDGRKGNCNGD